ncbi:hypothetical protein D3C80_1482460 [compost metagenome]
MLHIAEEERQDQRSDVRTIDIGIRHDDYFMVTQFGQVQRFRIFFCTYCYTKCRVHILDLLIFIDLMFLRFFYVQDLTS